MATKGEVDVLVVGAGPAGITAANAASESGMRVAVVDGNPEPGGQLWRGEKRPLRAQFIQAEHLNFTYRRLVIATGARELLLPFPGWTLPGVFAAGGLQALAKSGLRVQGKRVLVAGSGPLLLAVAATLRRLGAQIVAILEQAPRQQVMAFALSNPRKLLQGAALKTRLLGVPFYYDSWVTSVRPGLRVQTNSGREFECDWAACGFGLMPNIELAQLLCCRIKDGFVAADQFQQTSEPGIYCAGEVMAVGGLDLALASGRIAGYAATGQLDKARRRFARRDRALRFAASLRSAFTLRPELLKLAAEDTIVCRCEDVPWSAVRPHTSWKSAKLHTRCGMGPCQGRTCGPILQFLQGFELPPPRPPLFPVRAGDLAEAGAHPGHADFGSQQKGAIL
jgi:NADPH-dependent 2,4-dienoyl-CoA reductase/sulfur reductase-like enzyme